MRSELLSEYKWNDEDGCYKHHQLPGTEDWAVVAHLFYGDYEWCEFNAFYSPSEHRYFWNGDYGCSCNSWIEGVSSSESFANGSRDDLLRAWRAFAEDNTYKISPSSYQRGAETIRRFNPENPE